MAVDDAADVRHATVADFHVVIVKELKKTHRFSVTLSFAPKRSSDRTLFNEEHTSLYTN